ncbi:hypothetical protein Dsin_001479 [Dipteronia sinensis]|uniref:Cytochrome P450 n=1 Tax=Dipteronia sinensis TaxID=43782 RepID=A0AAE0EID3_9ROSI|nr:hypothetical protein Dsin_001479 [Dipteronia sinensis]
MMDLLSYLQCIFLTVIFIIFLCHFNKNSKFLCNSPLVGMFPELIFNLYKFHDKVAQLLEERKGTFLHRGVWFGQMNMLFTSDPTNVRYIVTMNANFSNYVKGPEWRKRFDIFGDHRSLFSSDFDEWKHQRKVIRAFLSHHELNQHVAKIIPDIIEKGLIPILDNISEQDNVVDLQDLFSLIATGSKTNSLMCIGLTENQFLKALDDACEAIFARHVIPETFWKLQRWLGIGKERKYKKRWKIIDKFWEKHLSIKREKLSNAMTISEDQAGFNALASYLTPHEIVGQTPTSNVTRGNLEQLNKLVYLHAALCEALRLFPPVPPYELRTLLRPDTLPSGHQVDQKTGIFISSYAMGRTASIWGEDCHKFKPERWITKEGGIKHEASHKFFAFNAGPRICPGKEIGFTLMKAIITTIIHNYHVQLVETHPVTPNPSMVLRMKHGLMATINNRWA